MAAIRENISKPSARDAFLDGIVALDQEMTAITSARLARFLRDNRIPLGMRGIVAR